MFTYLVNGKVRILHFNNCKTQVLSMAQCITGMNLMLKKYLLHKQINTSHHILGHKAVVMGPGQLAGDSDL